MKIRAAALATAAVAALAVAPATAAFAGQGADVENYGKCVTDWGVVPSARLVGPATANHAVGLVAPRGGLDTKRACPSV